MYQLNVYSQKGEIVGKQNLPDEIFGLEPNMVLLNEAIRFYRALKRQGTASTKTRGEVRGGGRKPWRQKHTGRARAGSRRSPIWVGGGIAFGPKPRDYSYSFPKKKKRLALFQALSIKAKDGKIILLDDLKMEKPKTRLFYEMMQVLGLSTKSKKDRKKCLFLPEKIDENVYKSGRNIEGVEFKTSKSINALDVLHSNTLIFTLNGLNAFTKCKTRDNNDEKSENDNT